MGVCVEHVEQLQELQLFLINIAACCTELNSLPTHVVRCASVLSPKSTIEPEVAQGKGWGGGGGGVVTALANLLGLNLSFMTRM